MFAHVFTGQTEAAEEKEMAARVYVKETLNTLHVWTWTNVVNPEVLNVLLAF